jgi:glycine cleavage system aminomethyltransferase T
VVEAVSVLDFLSVSAAADHDGMHPVARSATERAYRDAGATFEERHGWLVPVSVPGERERLGAVGIADLSHLAKWEIRPAGDPVEGRGVVWYRISARRALVLAEPDAELPVRDLQARRLVLDVSAGLSVLALAGPAAATLVRRLTHLHDFPCGGEVAHVTAHVLAPAPDTYWVIAPQEYGHYLWEVAVDVASALGGGPVGVDALARRTA